MNVFSKGYWKKINTWETYKYYLISFCISSLCLIPWLIDKLPILKLVFLIFIFGIWISSILDWKYDLPNHLINDDESNKKEFRIMAFLGTSFGCYIIFIGYLYEYYPLLKNYIGAKWIISHFNF